MFEILKSSIVNISSHKNPGGITKVHWAWCANHNSAQKPGNRSKAGAKHNFFFFFTPRIGGEEGTACSGGQMQSDLTVQNEWENLRHFGKKEVKTRKPHESLLSITQSKSSGKKKSGKKKKKALTLICVTKLLSKTALRFLRQLVARCKMNLGQKTCQLSSGFKRSSFSQ